MTFSTGLKRLACRLSLSVAYLAWGYAGLFLWILYLAYSGHLPDWFQAIPYYDKPAHGVLYAIASYLGHRLLRGKSILIQGIRLPLFPLLFACFTTGEELLQGLAPTRTLDGIDLICSLVGAWLGYRLAERSLAKAPADNPGAAKSQG
ncbi:MAG: hypothetical protein HC824_17745 [Synechococcales cyanobacterium RM1_1_8]|nr:hypothetical protein [Synechococcales cyanobacterium RM1_1_8]